MGKYQVECANIVFDEKTGGDLAIPIELTPGFYPNINIFAGIGYDKPPRGGIYLYLQDKNKTKDFGSFPRFFAKFLFDRAIWQIHNIYLKANVNFIIAFREVEVDDKINYGYYATREVKA